MRISDTYHNQFMQQRLQNARTKLEQDFEKLSSQKNISRLSHEASLVRKSISLNQADVSLEQNQETTQEVENRMNHYQTLLQQVTQAINDLKDFLVSENKSGSYTDNATIANTMESYMDTMKALANTQDGDRYVFSGTLTDVIPYDAANVYQGNNEVATMESLPGMEHELNITGAAVFGDGGSVSNFFEDLSNVINDVRSGTTGAIGAAEDLVDTLAERVTDQIYDVGIQLNRAALSDSMAESKLVTNQESRASYEAIDYAEMISVYEYDNMALNASLSVASDMMSHTLLDYMN